MSAFTLKTSIRHSCLFELLPLNIILGVLARVNKQENEIKSNHIVAEEAILSSFAEDTILNIDSHKEFTQTFRSNRQAVQVYHLSHSSSPLFIFLMEFFAEQNLILIILSFLLLFVFLASYLRIHCQIWGHEDLLLCFLLGL
jgi:hypothetical protein